MFPPLAANAAMIITIYDNDNNDDDYDDKTKQNNEIRNVPTTGSQRRWLWGVSAAFTILFHLSKRQFIVIIIIMSIIFLIITIIIIIMMVISNIVFSPVQWATSRNLQF